MNLDRIVQLVEKFLELPAVFRIFFCQQDSAIMHGGFALDAHNEISAAGEER